MSPEFKYEINQKQDHAAILDRNKHVYMHLKMTSSKWLYLILTSYKNKTSPHVEKYQFKDILSARVHPEIPQMLILSLFSKLN